MPLPPSSPNSLSPTTFPDLSNFDACILLNMWMSRNVARRRGETSRIRGGSVHDDYWGGWKVATPALSDEEDYGEGGYAEFEYAYYCMYSLFLIPILYEKSMGLHFVSMRIDACAFLGGILYHFLTMRWCLCKKMETDPFRTSNPPSTASYRSRQRTGMVLSSPVRISSFFLALRVNQLYQPQSRKPTRERPSNPDPSR
jgi:hypothetical protein